MAQVINIANFKGGVGKTTTSVILAFLLSERKRKVLFIDFDPQANATSFLYYKTFKNEVAPETTIYTALKNRDLSQAIYRLSDYMDIIPAEGDLNDFSRLLNRLLKLDYDKYPFLLDALLTPIKDDYDFIFIDVPPTISDFTHNAIVATDHIAIIMYTQEFSLGAAEDFIPYINELISAYETDVNFLAAIPFITSKRSRVDKLILKEARKVLSDTLTNNKIELRERVKVWGVSGIENKDAHDRKVIKMYNALLDELLDRINQ